MHVVSYGQSPGIFIPQAITRLYACGSRQFVTYPPRQYAPCPQPYVERSHNQKSYDFLGRVSSIHGIQIEPQEHVPSHVATSYTTTLEVKINH